MNKEFTLKLQAWLNTPKEQRNFEEGALLLLQLSNNKILYANVSRNLAKHADFIEFKLRRYLDFRLQDLTHAEVEDMQAKVSLIAKEHALDKDITAPSKKEGVSSSPAATATSTVTASDTSAWRTGKRADHDTLPVEIQALYAENATIMHQMRELHLKLRTLSTAESTCPDSDRYPFLKEIIALDKRYHKNWQIYDNYSAEPASPTATPDSVSANAPVKTAAIATPSTTAAETAEPTAAEFRQQQKKIYRQINLTKGRFKKNPTDALRQKLAVLYAQLASPTGTLTTELKELGIIE
jgi:hypothetical protein